MKRTYSLIISLLMLGCSTTAFALTTGFYTGIEAGYATLSDLPGEGNITSASSGTIFMASASEDRDFGGRLYIGYNKGLTRSFGIGVELGYGHYGTADQETRDPATLPSPGKLDISTMAWDLLLVNTWRINHEWDVFIKTGLAYATTSYDSQDGLRSYIASTGGRTKVEGTNFEGVLGIGTAYNFNRNFSLTLTYTHIFGDDAVITSSISNDQAINQLAYGEHTTMPVDTIFFGGKYSFDIF